MLWCEHVKHSAPLFTNLLTHRPIFVTHHHSQNRTHISNRYHDAAKFQSYQYGYKEVIKELFLKSEKEGQAVRDREGESLSEPLRKAIDAIDLQRLKFLEVVEGHLE